MEGFKFEEPAEKKEREKTPQRLLLALEAQLKLTVKELKLHGEENIEAIPAGKKIIIATTHISDIDIPTVAAALGKYFNIAITNMSVHHSFLAEPSTNIGVRLAGKENFIPFDYEKTPSGKQASFNPDNFEPMKRALDDGKAIIVAAHNPTHDWHLSKGGYGVSYLSDISDDVVILPVAVDLESAGQVGMYENQLKTITKKPVANVFIGEPIELQKIPGIEDLSKIMHKRESGERITPEELKRFSELKELLQTQSNIVMEKLAENLPEEKRGEYKTKK
jgi:hypothetical protein